MRLGIIGLPNSGKTTIFNALTNSNLPTGAATSGQMEINTAIVDVPDPRVEKLSELAKPNRKIYAKVTYVDIGGLDKGISDGGLKGQFRNELSHLDGLLHVVRVFEDDNVPHPYDTVDAQRDIDTLDSEFMLADLVMIEARLAKIAEELRRKGRTIEQGIQAERETLERMKAALENDQPLRDLEFTEAELKPLRGYGFLSLKPMLVVLNAGDDPVEPSIITYDHKNTGITTLQGKIESELAQLPPDDQAMFMEEYGITELSAAKVIRLSYQLMNIQCFFTVGKEEIHVWSIPIGATAPEAASAIHTDLQKGFIRAEVMAYEDYIEHGSEAALKQAGKFRLEGKDYIVKDGDIVHIRSGL